MPMRIVGEMGTPRKQRGATSTATGETTSIGSSNFSGPHRVRPYEAGT